MIQDSILRNASTHLQIRIFGNDDQVVHPSVIDFKTEHGMESWNGYQYWMALTPYPYGDSSKENPCLCVSNDGLSWEAPRDIINPLDVARGGWIEGFHSDTDMIYNPERDELWIYYRFLTNERYVVKLIRLTSDMKIIGPDHIIDNMADEAPWKRGSDLRSMAIWRESAEQWHMWAGTGERWNHKNNKGPCDTVYLKSADGITWSEPEICLNDRGVDPFQDIGYSNWHISAKPNHEDRKVEFLCYCDNMSGGKDGLIYAVCDMSNPTHIICPLERPVLIPSDFGWDSGTLYRSSFVRERRGKDSVFRVWYSASSKKKLWQRLLRPLFLLSPIFPSAYKLHARWYIGYTEGSWNK